MYCPLSHRKTARAICMDKKEVTAQNPKTSATTLQLFPYRPSLYNAYGSHKQRTCSHRDLFATPILQWNRYLQAFYLQEHIRGLREKPNDAASRAISKAMQCIPYER